MKPGRTGTSVSGWLLLLLGGAMVLIIGKGDLTVIFAGLLVLFSGVYLLSLSQSSSQRFMGEGWTAKICRISTFIVGLLLVVSGFTSVAVGLSEALISWNPWGLGFVVIGLLCICWGIYVLNLAVKLPGPDLRS